MSYVTLTKGDPEFESYLLGTFSSTHRALPVETYNTHQISERVTFKLVPIEQIKTPPWWRIYFLSCRPELALLMLGPAAGALLNLPERAKDWNMGASVAALLGIFFLQTAIFLLNDVQDHMRGADRQNRRRGSQVIQKGWVTGYEMRRWAWINGAIALLLGLPGFTMAPMQLLALCGLAFLALTLFVSNWGTRWGLSDLALALLFGPLLTVGLALASFGYFSDKDVLLGIGFGFLTLWLFQVRQLENLFRAKPEAFRTFLGFLAFDHARLVMMAEGILVLLLQMGIAIVFRVPLIMLALLLFFSWPLWLTWLRLYKATSPLASPLLNISRWALTAHMAWVFWWWLTLGSLWL